MNKKLIGSVVALATVVVVLVVNRRHDNTPAPAPRVVAETPVGAKASAAPAAPAASAHEEQEDAEGEAQVTKSLKGKDFSLQVTVNGNDSFRNLEVSMSDDRQIRLVRSRKGEISELSNLIFSPADNFELKRFIPDDAREQILCKGSQFLSRGAGSLGSYSLYRIEDDHLQELVSLLTEREVEDGNGFTPQKLHATVEETTRDGQPAIIYRVKADKHRERIIVFRWNGKIFEDASGQYDKIIAEYIP
ncbi:hypothetical protein LPN04_10680 [Rugamonas sp. A1-17]|nr:hypothetical protein [Rugamonas sp. A1-17]